MRALVLCNFILSLAVLFNSSLASAQSPDEEAVAQAVGAFRKAIIAKDRSQLEALIADQLHYWHSDGRVETKRKGGRQDAVNQDRRLHGVAEARRPVEATGAASPAVSEGSRRLVNVVIE